ncbi:MAG: response regulator [Bdellovibrionales bacterium]|nr:response regulator [Bdellovibrionales bacterium]
MLAQIQAKAGKILVVEDNLDLRSLMRKALELKNYEVLQAANGTEAFDLLEKDLCPDLILLDLSMPGMTGTEFMERLRNHAKYSRIKTIIVSGWNDLSERVNELGADGFIRKPVDLHRLFQEVGRHVGV